MSNVERQIDRWRDTLRTSDALGGPDIAELESHLREEMERLQPLGLSEMESFLIARHRLGPTGALETEYEKVNTDRRSRLRLFWMATGVLVYILAGYIAVGVSHGGMVVALRQDPDPAALAWIGVATKAVAAGALLLVVWICVQRCAWSRLTGRLRTLSLPWLIGLLGGLAVAGCAALGFELLFRMAAVRCVNGNEYAQMALVWGYAKLGWTVLAPVLAALLVIVLRTRADRCRDTAQSSA